MKNTKKWLLNQIAQVASGSTDFDVRFDMLFRFMAKNPESETAEKFAEYHIIEMGNPKTQAGEADFTYLIGRSFNPEEWIEMIYGKEE